MKHIKIYEEFNFFNKKEPNLIEKIIKSHKNGEIEINYNNHFIDELNPNNIIQFYEFDFEGDHYEFKVFCDNYMRVNKKELFKNGEKLNIDPDVLKKLTNYTNKI